MEEDATKVFCGPITVEEIRYHLATNKPPEMIGRRATISDLNPERTIYSNCPTEDYLIRKQYFGSISEELSDSFVSEYLTPNETACTDTSGTASNLYATPCESFQNSAKVENITPPLIKNSNNFMEPNNDECSNPNSIFVNVHKDKENFIEEMTKVLSSSNCSIPYKNCVEEHPNVNVYKDNDRFTFFQPKESQYLDLIKDTILLSSDDDDDDDDVDNNKSSKMFNNESIPETSFGNNQNINSSAIYISSDPDSSIEEQPENKIQLHEELGLQQNEKSVETIDLEALSLNDDVKTEVLSADDSNITDLSDPINTSCGTSKTVNQVENISVSSLQESSDYDFNDTLEEMEMALKHGLDYTMPDERTDYYKTDIPEQVVKETMEEANKPDLPTNTPTFSSSTTYKKTLIPVKSPRVNTQPDKALTPKTDFNFKIPSKPLQLPVFKNVISPVAVYIKNSPTVPQVQHIPAKPFISKPLFPKSIGTKVCNKENEELPCRVYKPAKHTVVVQEKEIKLPVCVQKYVKNTATVIKHHGRMAEKKTDPVTVEEKLLREDLTVCDSDASFSTSSVSLQDVSYRTTKKTYIS